MRYYATFAPKPAGPLAEALDAAAARMADKLSTLNIDALAVSDYTSCYLGDLTRGLRRVMQRYVHLLALSLDGRSTWDNLVLMDYGAGPGLLAFLAKELGVGTVIHNDIYDVSCRDAKITGDALGTAAEHVVCGDLDEAVRYCREAGLSCDVVTNWDVLEHVYKPHQFLRKLPDLSTGPLRIVMASTANEANPLLRRGLKRSQIAADTVDQPNVWGHKERDSLRAYRTVRREMIAAHAPDLPEHQLDILADMTRGLAGDDIGIAVDHFGETGDLPYPSHPTNTCDPLTGNWCEQMLPPAKLVAAARDAGFRARVLPGFYGHYPSVSRRIVATGLNAAIRLFGRSAMPLSLVYILVADRSA